MDWRRVWNSPNTLVGRVAMGLCGGSKAFRDRGDGHYEALPGTTLDRILVSQLGKSAITLGDIVLYGPGCSSNKKRVTHEMQHIKQSRAWGPFFLPAYGLASVWSRVRYGNWYAGNWFERDAKAHEKHEA